MRLFPQFLYPALAVTLVAAAGLPAAPPPKTVTPSMQDAKYPPHEPGLEKAIRSTQVLRESGDYDFNYQMLRWRGEGKCNQKEGQSPIFDIKGDDIVLRNAFILDAPDGIHVSGHNVKIQNVYFMNICEDAITSSGAVDLDITGCYFYDAEDKVLQLNYGRDIEIYGNVFSRFASAVRVKDGTSGVQVRNNLFLDGKRAVFSDGKHARVDYVGENMAAAVLVFALAEDHSRIQLNGGNRFVKVKDVMLTHSGGKVSEE